MSRLDALLVGRETLLHEVERVSPTGGIRREAATLLGRCEQLGVEGVEKIGANVGGIDKFFAILSEFRTAILFANLGAKVRILKDEAFGQCRKNQSAYYTPDLIVTFGDLNILVEVVRASAGTPDVFTPLHRGIEERSLPFSVESFPGVGLSCPLFDGAEKKQFEKRVDEVVDELLEKLSRVRHGSTGELWIGEHLFRYKPSAKGYAAGGVTAVHWIDDEKHENNLLKALHFKAKKQPKLPIAWQGVPFVVAYENWETECDDLRVLSTLTGTRTAYVGLKPPPVNHPPKVMAAWNSPWRRLLQEWDYGPDAECRILRCGAEPHRGICNHNSDIENTSHPEHYGAFDGCDWAQNLSGVLVLHSRYKIQWLPNPFAEEAIRELRLLDLGLSIEKLGSHHPDLLKL